MVAGRKCWLTVGKACSRAWTSILTLLITTFNDQVPSNNYRKLRMKRKLLQRTKLNIRKYDRVTGTDSVSAVSHCDESVMITAKAGVTSFPSPQRGAKTLCYILKSAQLKVNWEKKWTRRVHLERSCSEFSLCLCVSERKIFWLLQKILHIRSKTV